MAFYGAAGVAIVVMIFGVAQLRYGMFQGGEMFILGGAIAGLAQSVKDITEDLTRCRNRSERPEPSIELLLRADPTSSSGPTHGRSRASRGTSPSSA
jgi:hypothetical protein